MERYSALSVEAAVSQILGDLIHPPIRVNGESVLEIPSDYRFKLQGGLEVYAVLDDIEQFCAASELLINCFLETLCIVLRNEYDAIRLRSVETSGSVQSSVTTCLPARILALLGACIEPRSLSDGIMKRLIRLFQLVAPVSITPSELHDYLRLLKKPTNLSLSLLQGLETITDPRTSVKAFPDAVFNFWGDGAGVNIPGVAFPFVKEMQVDFYFRVELNAHDEARGAHRTKQCLVTMLDLLDQGVEISVEERQVCVRISSSPIDSTFVRLEDVRIEDGVWYHFTLLYGKAKFSLFGTDDLSVLIDGDTAYAGNARFPTPSQLGEIDNFSIGKKFHGQMGAVVFYLDRAQQPQRTMRRRLSAGKLKDDYVSSRDVDLVSVVAMHADKKVLNIDSNVVYAYHPARTAGPYAFDIHSGMHGLMSTATTTWVMKPANEVLISVGGLSVLLPLFPIIFTDPIEASASVSASQFSPKHSGRRSPGGEVEGGGRPVPFDDSSVERTLGSPLSSTLDDRGVRSTLSAATLIMLEHRRSVLGAEGCIALLLNVLAGLLQAFRCYRQQFRVDYAVDMIEYGLRHIYKELFAKEGASVVTAMQKIRQALRETPVLENRFMKKVFFNVEIWSRAPFAVQTALMASIRADARVHPGSFHARLPHGVVLAMVTRFFNAWVDNSRISEMVLGEDTGLLGGGEGPNRRASWNRDDSPGVQLVHSPNASGGVKRRSSMAAFRANIDTEISTQKSIESPGSPGASGEWVMKTGAGFQSGEFASEESTSTSSSSNDNIIAQMSAESVDSSPGFVMKSAPRSPSRSNLFMGSADPGDDVGNAALSTSRSKLFLSSVEQGDSQLETDSPTLSAGSDVGGGGDRVVASASVDNNAEAATDEDAAVDSELDQPISRLTSIGSLGSPHSHDDGDVPTAGGGILRSGSAGNTALQRNHRRELRKLGQDSDVVASHLSLVERQDIRQDAFLLLNEYGDECVLDILDSLVVCGDDTVAQELASYLTKLLHGQDAGVLRMVVQHSGRPDAFCALVLRKFVTHRLESMRCCGVRLLSAFLDALDTYPANVVWRWATAENNNDDDGTVNSGHPRGTGGGGGEEAGAEGMVDGTLQFGVLGGFQLVFKLLGTYVKVREKRERRELSL